MNPLDSISLTIHSFSPSHTLQSMPESVFDKISSSKLVFVKGDANYRRLLVRRMIMRSSLLGFYSSLFLFHWFSIVLLYITNQDDRQWPLTENARNILSYWQVPVCALRTFKAEMGCGISEEQQKRAAAADSKWMVSGKWGVVQLGGVLATWLLIWLRIKIPFYPVRISGLSYGLSQW